MKKGNATMKKMKLIMTLMVILICNVYVAKAGGNDQWGTTTPVQVRAQGYTDFLKTDLKLANEQVAKIYQINYEIGKKYDSVANICHYQGYNDFYKAVKKLGLERDSKMEDVLSARQYNKYLHASAKLTEVNIQLLTIK